jgi:hypothetical protein
VAEAVGPGAVPADGLLDHRGGLQCVSGHSCDRRTAQLIAYFRILLEWDERLRIKALDQEAA